MQIVQQLTENVNSHFHEEGITLVNNFFIVFSRFEFALKQSITYAHVKPSNRVEPNWETFADSIEPKFKTARTKELNDAVDLLLNDPPRVQYLVNNAIAWQHKPPQNVSEIRKLSQHIRDVRNNLFHGGKFQGHWEPGNSRNFDLINASMIILNEWLELSDDVRPIFLGHIQ